MTQTILCILIISLLIISLMIAYRHYIKQPADNEYTELFKLHNNLRNINNDINSLINVSNDLISRAELDSIKFNQQLDVLKEINFELLEYTYRPIEIDFNTKDLVIAKYDNRLSDLIERRSNLESMDKCICIIESELKEGL